MKSFSLLAIPDECRQEEYRGLMAESTLKMQFVCYVSLLYRSNERNTGASLDISIIQNTTG